MFFVGFAPVIRRWSDKGAHYGTMGDTYVNWTRDDTITGDVYQKSYFDRMIERNQVNAYLKERKKLSVFGRK